jgi:hypothetical protein
MWWYTHIILTTWEAETGGLQLEASLGKKLAETLSEKQARHGGAQL